MSTLASIYLKLETLETLVSTLKKKAEKGISIDVSLSDTTNEWGQNVSTYVSQTKEQREAKTPRFYTGNGKVFWTDGKITIADKVVKETEKSEPIDTIDDLPF